MNVGYFMGWFCAVAVGLPITLIFWAHIYVAVRDIVKRNK